MTSKNTRRSKPTVVNRTRRPVTKSQPVKSEPVTSQPTFVERRSAPRVVVSDLPAFTAQLVDGPAIEIINVSRTGVLTRSEARLMPGAMIALRVLTAEENIVLFGRVVRSRLM